MRLAIIRRMWQFDPSILQKGASHPLWDDLWRGRLIGLNPEDKSVPLQAFTVSGKRLGVTLVFDWVSDLSFVRLYQKRKYTGLAFSTVF